MLVKEKKSGLQKRVEEIELFIGNTPLFPIKGFVDNPDVTLWAKLEWTQLGCSVKARPAFNIIKEAILAGELDGSRHLLDASSGNTGVAYGAIGAAVGIPVTLCLPENASDQKKASLTFHGVNIIYTSRLDGTDGAQEKAKELSQQFPDRYLYVDQYNNDNNWLAHYKTTAHEIFKQTDGRLTHFVAALGTTGTFIGTSRKLKELNKHIEVIALHPDSALHGLEGWKHLETAKVPGIYDGKVADKNLNVSTEEAYQMVKEVAKKTGLLLSPSSAGALSGAVKAARAIKKGVVVTVFPDHGSNYPEVLKELLKGI
ncbi:MAG TPA: cysteine synthase family protein [Chitinophagales bacterium]|nr:cysteine synthase family protein [Chitinophagales bacterium]